MDVRKWIILCWNVRGINSDKKWHAIKDRINDSFCDIICLQETKRETFDDAYIRNFCPPSFDQYVVLPSVGASGGAIVISKSSLFLGSLVFHNSFALFVEFNSKHNGDSFLLTNVYAPCSYLEKLSFLDWFKNIQMPDSVNWIIVGDFNLCRSPDDRNKPGGP